MFKRLFTVVLLCGLTMMASATGGVFRLRSTRTRPRRVPAGAP